MIRIAILDLYEGRANQGMRCIRQIISEWSEFHGIESAWKEFDVRLKNEVPNLDYDVYISSGDSIPQIPRSKQYPKIMVWGGISW